MTHLLRLEEKIERCMGLSLPSETDGKFAGRNQLNHVRCIPVPWGRHSTTTTYNRSGQWTTESQTVGSISTRLHSSQRDVHRLKHLEIQVCKKGEATASLDCIHWQDLGPITWGKRTKPNETLLYRQKDV